MSEKIPTPEEMAQWLRLSHKWIGVLRDWRDAIRRECARAYVDFCTGSGRSYYPLCADKIEHAGEEED